MTLSMPAESRGTICGDLGNDEPVELRIREGAWLFPRVLELLTLYSRPVNVDITSYICTSRAPVIVLRLLADAL